MRPATSRRCWTAISTSFCRHTCAGDELDPPRSAKNCCWSILTVPTSRGASLVAFGVHSGGTRGLVTPWVVQVTGCTSGENGYEAPIAGEEDHDPLRQRHEDL